MINLNEQKATSPQPIAQQAISPYDQPTVAGCAGAQQVYTNWLTQV